MFGESQITTFMSSHKVMQGLNSIESLPGIVDESGGKNVLIVTDKGVLNAGIVSKSLRELEASGLAVDLVTAPPEPAASDVTDLYRQTCIDRPDVVIGFGGGSAMDTAKLLSALFTNNCLVEELIGTNKVPRKGLPTIMVPTTSGTGAEATPNAIVTLPDQSIKAGVVSPFLIADYVILDPLLTLSLPPAITAATGIDALTHAIECYISKAANPISDTFALQAISLIYNNIETAYTDGSNIKARHAMLIGSFLGGMCIASSSTAAVHALAYPLGGMFKIPHGVSNAILLPYVMKFNPYLPEVPFLNTESVGRG